MDDVKIEKWTLEDGRRAERRVTEIKNSNGECEKVVELLVEDERPLKLQQRVVEKCKPMLYERKLETIDPNTGNVVEQKIESLESKVPMQVVEHIAASSNPQSDLGDNKPVTKQEMIDAIVAAIKANRELSLASHAEKKCVKAQGLAEEFQKLQIPQKDGMSMMDKILLVVIASQVVGLGYILFFM
jgi:hypothetical protein